MSQMLLTPTCKGKLLASSCRWGYRGSEAQELAKASQLATGGAELPALKLVFLYRNSLLPIETMDVSKWCRCSIWQAWLPRSDKINNSTLASLETWPLLFCYLWCLQEGWAPGQHWSLPSAKYQVFPKEIGCEAAYENPVRYMGVCWPHRERGWGFPTQMHSSGL